MPSLAIPIVAMATIAFNAALLLPGKMWIGWLVGIAIVAYAAFELYRRALRTGKRAFIRLTLLPNGGVELEQRRGQQFRGWIEPPAFVHPWLVSVTCKVSAFDAEQPEQRQPAKRVRRLITADATPPSVHRQLRVRLRNRGYTVAEE